ncbi:hypothetical protein B398_03520 [Xylella fastidiosa 32]|nr:hypothetical protein B398_03520 [Xylella fastidiosa 32]
MVRNEAIHCFLGQKMSFSKVIKLGVEMCCVQRGLQCVDFVFLTAAWIVLTKKDDIR